MFYSLLRYYYNKKPIFLGWLYKLLFSGGRIKIGKNFRCDSFPRILVDKKAKVHLGDHVIFRRNVEIRAHQDSTISIKDNCRIDRGVRILSTNDSNIVLEKGVRVGLYSVFNGGSSISIGEKTLISGYVYLQTSMHNYFQESVSIQDQGYRHDTISLGDDCWLGAHVVVLPGVELKDKCIVGSNSVVNKSFEEKSIVAGLPAKIIKSRK